MRIIQDWLLALRVCIKYRIIWNPFIGLSNASFSYRFDSRGVLIKKVVTINPFYPNFINAFMHEVGHLVLYKNGIAQKIRRYARLFSYYQTETILYKGKTLLEVLIEESMASRFARKALKEKSDRRFLVRAFQTYSKRGYEQLLLTTPQDATTITKLTDFVSKGIRRIEK